MISAKFFELAIIIPNGMPPKEIRLIISGELYRARWMAIAL